MYYLYVRRAVQCQPLHVAFDTHQTQTHTQRKAKPGLTIHHTDGATRNSATLIGPARGGKMGRAVHGWMMANGKWRRAGTAETKNLATRRQNQLREAEHFRNGTFGALPLLKHDADSFTLVKNDLNFIYPTRLRKVISARTFDLFCL